MLSSTFLRAVRLLVALSAIGVIGACVAERSPRSPGGHAASEFLDATGAPAVPPPQIEMLAGKLMIYRAHAGRLPATLHDLIDAGQLEQTDYDALTGCAYSPRGLGVLPDAKLIILVDSAIRVPNRAWCVLGGPPDDDPTEVLELTLVPMGQLQAAAARADKAHATGASRTVTPKAHWPQADPR